MTLDIAPVIGDIKGVVELFTNKDLISGEDVGPTRYLALLGLSREVKVLRKLFKFFSNSEDVIRQIGALESKLAKIEVELDDVISPRIEQFTKQKKELEKGLKEINSTNDPQGFAKSAQEDSIKKIEDGINKLKEARAEAQRNRNNMQQELNNLKKELDLE